MGNFSTISNFVTFNPTFMFAIKVPAAPGSGSLVFDYDFTINYDL